VRRAFADDLGDGRSLVGVTDNVNRSNVTIAVTRAR
jgi:hypothetical protein